jgi:hypothetical protein
MERQGERPIDSRDLAHRRAVAWRLYERAAALLLAADGRAAADGVRGQPPAALRAAARLQTLAAYLEAPELALAPVAATVIQPRRGRAS